MCSWEWLVYHEFRDMVNMLCDLWVWSIFPELFLGLGMRFIDTIVEVWLITMNLEVWLIDLEGLV